MFKKGLKWLKKATKEDATAKVEKTKIYDGYPVYGWDQETHDVRLIDAFATRELALDYAKYLKNFHKNVVVMDPYGAIEKML